MLIFSMAQPPLRPQDAVMLIPSLEPDDRLPAYVRRLLDKGFQHVVIVDDGSSAAYQPIFAELDAMDGVSVTHHEVKAAPSKPAMRIFRRIFRPPAASSPLMQTVSTQSKTAGIWQRC